jgi:hypothetical protein
MNRPSEAASGGSSTATAKLHVLNEKDWLDGLSEENYGRTNTVPNIGSSQSKRILHNLAAMQFPENCVAIIIIEF